MTINYTTLLGLAKPVTGTEANTWGTVVNDEITSLLDTAVAGTTTLSSDADVTLTTTTGAANQARQAIILWTAGGTTLRTITAPAQSKVYIVINKTSSTQSIKLVGVGPTTGVTIVAGEYAVCAWNGVDFVKVSNLNGAGTFTSLTDSGNLTFTGTGNRITGDFSNSTLANRVMFQTSTVNANTGVGFLPNGTSTTAFLQVFNAADPTNSSYADIRALAGDMRFSSSISGTGTYLPMTFYTSGSERMRIATDGKVGIGTASAAVSLAISATDAILIPAGTTAQQPTGVAGYLRFNTTTTQFEGYNGTSWASVGGATLSNDTSTSSNVYPLFASATSGSATTIYTSNAKLLYKPSTGEFQASVPVASNGIFVNNATVAASYSIASGYNGHSVGPMTIASGQSVTVASGQRWIIL